ncbi:hypothetical protein DEJ33_00220 [Curtobacterium sp. MCPF17_047]|uniref:hypothetical protein n=1 Tax=unclassified Curtobacterium TaxID=257496 RepID=UPI000DA79625|nr:MULTISPECIES: hypothetical protein [unclassified Curtobacterium]PZE62916.1 hypothetical protein DEJ24_01205 [Curtobacterium sp. MCPF17_001]PZF68845.1 hypothetical protein DEJ33_00220 [Curtobacterium sp. MCPF17_047]
MDDAVGTRLSGRQRKARVVAFWPLTVLGAPIMCAAWIWLTLASTEQVTESAKAPPGDTSTDGLFVTFGVVPLVLAHLLGLVILRSIAPRERDERGASWAIAAVAVLVTSGIGLALALQFNGGVLLTPNDGGYTP